MKLPEFLKKERNQRYFGFLCLFLILLLIVLGNRPAHAATPRAIDRIHHAIVHRPSKHKHGKTAGSRPEAQPVAVVSKEPNDAPDFDYRPQILEAQALLQKQPVLKSDMRIGKHGKLAGFEWLLAVKHGASPIEIVRMDERGRNAQGFTVTRAVDNFINTKFRVVKPEGYHVLAQRRPIHAKEGFAEAVYTAYQPEMDTKTMRDAGLDYLRFLQRHAFNAINDHDVRSHVAPNQTVAEKIPASMILRLMITEHVDPLHMKSVGLQQCIHEVLFTLAANREHAYQYAKSSAGARGLPQFMETSYQMVRKDYPAARLEPDFIRGMLDLPNAVLASVLLLDLELVELPREYLARFFSSTKGMLSAFLAAGYNCNPTTVVRTYLKTNVIGKRLPAETQTYVLIQDGVGTFLSKEYAIS